MPLGGTKGACCIAGKLSSDLRGVDKLLSLIFTVILMILIVSS
jgi:hypothetical protein